MSIAITNSNLPDIIELRGIGQSYDGGQRWVIQDFNLLIEDIPDQGQFVVILGMSGCGKSTILRHICGLQEPTVGEILINGQPRSKITPHISMVFQQYSSMPWMTVLDNVMLPLRYANVNSKEAKERAMEMLRVVGLLGHEKKWAQYPILSGGQLQRVAIARSLVSNPNIILMDEPFGALDPVTKMNLEQFVANIWTEVQSTIILVTHDIRQAVFLGDDIYIMSTNPGQLVRHIKVDLPLKRDRETRKTQRFIELVQEVDDAVYNLQTDPQVTS